MQIYAATSKYQIRNLSGIHAAKEVAINYRTGITPITINVTPIRKAVDCKYIPEILF
jgi:hypothetical protein